MGFLGTPLDLRQRGVVKKSRKWSLYSTPYMPVTDLFLCSQDKEVLHESYGLMISGMMLLKQEDSIWDHETRVRRFWGGVLTVEAGPSVLSVLWGKGFGMSKQHLAPLSPILLRSLGCLCNLSPVGCPWWALISRHKMAFDIHTTAAASPPNGGYRQQMSVQSSWYVLKKLH